MKLAREHTSDTPAMAPKARNNQQLANGARFSELEWSHTCGELVDERERLIGRHGGQAATCSLLERKSIAGGDVQVSNISYNLEAPVVGKACVDWSWRAVPAKSADAWLIVLPSGLPWCRVSGHLLFGTVAP